MITTILAIDPGFDRLGWAIGILAKPQPQILAFDIIQTDRKTRTSTRYLTLLTALDQIFAQYQPSHIAIESLFFTNNQKTAMRVSEARGIIVSCAIRSGLEIFEYTPPQIKQAVTGYGHADKIAIRKMVTLQTKINATGLVDDTLDALAILLTHNALYQSAEPPLAL